MKNTKDIFSGFTKIGKNGYLVVPRNLLEEVLCIDEPFTKAQAYLYLYMRASFCDRKGKNGLKRGQLNFTASELAKRFKWKLHAVRDFIHALRDQGVVSLEQVPGVNQQMTLCFYETLTCGHGKKVTPKEKKDFDEFWKRYYSLLDRKGTDLYSALSEWERLTAEERRLACKNMEAYFSSLNDIRFVKSAFNYLRFKTFLTLEDMDVLGPQ